MALWQQLQIISAKEGIMKQKKSISRKVFALFLATVLVLSSITAAPSTVHAAGWLEYANQTITLGTAVSASIKDGDYYGRTETVPHNSNGIDVYWHIYKFSMPKDGLLNIYLESTSEEYLKYNGYANGFVIYSVSNPDNIVWRSISGQNRIQENYSTPRAMYYGSTEIALTMGEYYFAVRQKQTNNDPYYLTLNYKEPIINVSSISLSPSNLAMEIGEQKTIIPTVLPNNATDKTVVWKSDNPSVATVENGMVKAVSIGTASISATSSDGEIKAVCPVIVACNHNYKSSISPAGIDSNGYISKTCTKCGTETKDWIAAIDSIELSETSYRYDGKEHKPSVTVLDHDGNALESGKDYVISYPDNTKEIGSYTVRIDFTGNYEGTEELGFTVLPVHVESVSLDINDMTLETGAQQKINAAVLPDNATDKSILWESSDSSVITVDDNGLVKAISVGTASVTATTVDGEETASCTVEVVCAHTYHTSLTPATQSKNGLLKEECSKCGKEKQNTTIYAISNLSLSATSYVYNGRTQTPSVTVRDIKGKRLQNNKDYTISYRGNQKDVGIHTVTVKFKGNYSGSLSKKFTIYPESTTITKVKPRKKGFTVSWKKQRTQITGYELAYSTSRSFRVNKTTITTVSRNKAKKTISKLKKRKRYYVRIRTYKNVMANGQYTRLYSRWSVAKKVTTKK